MMDRDFYTNDKVMNPDTKLFYSSKPPLLTVLLAGEYWLIKEVQGWTITANRAQVERTILTTFNCVPIAIMLVLIAWMAERLGTTDWAKLFVVAAACFATFVTTFAVVLNNHTVAAAVTAALASALRSGALRPSISIVDGVVGKAPPGPWWSFVVAGFFAGFAGCMDLPAAALAAGLGGLMLLRCRGELCWRSCRRRWSRS